MKSKIVVLGLVLFLFTGMLLAQSDRASITGTVTDSTGAVVPGVKVTATNVETNIQTTATTNGQGLYTILNLPIGHYSVSFNKDGFKSFERKGVTLGISQVAEINSVLQIGAAAETVTVTEDAPVLDTQTAAITTNLKNKDVAELPLNVQGGRELAKFMFAYVPGVEGNDYDSHINGSVAKSKEVMIDGVSAVAQIGGFLGESQPPMEGVEEFQVNTSGIRADEGRSGGGVFRYNMKSGTNTWHGSAFGFMHNEAFNANSTKNKYQLSKQVPAALAAGDTVRAKFLEDLYSRPKDRLYTWGGSFGGPIVKDKTFFYAAAERYTFENYGLGPMDKTVPTTAFLNGDFGALLDRNVVLGTDSAGNTVYKGAIIDPLTGNAFVNNIIPVDRFSATSRKLVDIFKQQYQPLAPGLVRNNAMPANITPWYHTTQFSVKIDHNLSDKHRLNGSFVYSRTPRMLADQGGIWAPGTNDGGPFANAYNHFVNAPSARISHSWTVSNNVLNVFNIAVNRFHNPSSAVSQKGNWPSTLGLVDTGVGNFPIIKFNGVNSDQHRTAPDGTVVSLDQLGSQYNDFYTANTFILSDNLSWVRGRHSLKFGGEFRAMQHNSHGDWGVPTVIFDPAQTAGSFGSNAGFGFASFLLGRANQGSVSMPNNTYGRRKTLSLYVQDDFKITPKLTVNMDLRWDFNGRYHEKFGRWSNFNTTMINPVTGLQGALEFAKDGSDSFERKQYWYNFAPHVGAAYQLTPKTVVRGSASVFYVPLNLNTWSGIPYGFNPGFVPNNQVLNVFNWDAGYPGQPVDIGKNPNFTRWGMVAIDPRALELGNVQQWTVSVQRELTSDMKIDVSYIENRGYHLQTGYLAGNQPKLSDYTAMVQAGQMWNWVTKPGFSGFGWASVAPFPNVAMTWGPLFWVGTPLGNSDYKSLQFSVTKRYTHGVSLQASYNLSRSHGNADTSFQETWWAGPVQDVYNLEKERHTISPFDQTHIVKGYVNLDLPFGRGKKFMTDAPAAIEAILGGWTLSTGFHYNSGTPMRVTSSNWYPGINNINSNFDPNCDLKLNPGAKIGGQYFNPACFSNPANGEFGNAPTYISQLRGFGLATEDIGLRKNFAFGSDSRFKLSVRFEMFNAFNRSSYAGAQTGFGSDQGKITDGGTSPRVGQVGARLTW